MSEITSTVETIKLYERDIESTKQQLKVVNERLQEELEDMPQYSAVKEAETALALAKEHLKNALLSNADYNNLLEEKAGLSEKMRDQKDILSNHLVFYFAETRENQIEMGEKVGDARQVIVTGKLGKRQKYQLNLFSQEKKDV